MASTPTSLDAFLEERPLPLVALVGETELHNALTSRKPAPDELHARYLSLPDDTKQLDYAGSSSQETSVVLKRDWLRKHTYVVAAVIALWFTWEADTPMAAILSRLESFRARCRPSCKIVLVLVTKATGAGAAFNALSSPAKDDERLSALRKAAELDSRSILSLTHVDGAGKTSRFEDSSVRRTERSLLEAALNYYKDETRNNKKMKQLGHSKQPGGLQVRGISDRAPDERAREYLLPTRSDLRWLSAEPPRIGLFPHEPSRMSLLACTSPPRLSDGRLAPATQAPLLARHHFKRAYYSEVRRDAISAAKHWQACSAALHDLLRVVVSPPSEAERSLVKLAEIKRVAEFVNRKILAASFEGFRIADACEAFRKHVRPPAQN